jgi:uncharacterized protein YbaR (Trm112 family)
MDKQLLDILVCPVCKGELICLADRLAYPIRDDIPVMLESEARKLSLDEYDALHKRRTAPAA